ncbi:MAG: c-type cytochrome domain-containing protein [Thermoanaerobaculia bacterium]|nr:c-type cytochrome domain-containing protein [Thermoanaerobaculia bacterium]
MTKQLRSPCLRLAAASVLASGLVVGARSQEAASVDYESQVKPIFETYCYECHGPDRQKREAEFRLDVRTGAFADLGGYLSIVPGDPEDSEIYLRVSSEFAEDRMPPYEAGTELTEEQIETIRLWIEQGAEWVGE